MVSRPEIHVCKYTVYRERGGGIAEGRDLQLICFHLLIHIDIVPV